jgi:hypothetical protein
MKGVASTCDSLALYKVAAKARFIRCVTRIGGLRSQQSLDVYVPGAFAADYTEFAMPFT